MKYLESQLTLEDFETGNNVKAKLDEENNLFYERLIEEKPYCF